MNLTGKMWYIAWRPHHPIVNQTNILIIIIEGRGWNIIIYQALLMMPLQHSTHGVHSVQCFNFLVFTMFSNNSLFTIITIAQCMLTATIKGTNRFFIIILSACIMPYICGLLLLIVMSFHGFRCSGRFRLCCGFVFIIIIIVVINFRVFLEKTSFHQTPNIDVAVGCQFKFNYECIRWMYGK